MPHTRKQSFRIKATGCYPSLCRARTKREKPEPGQERAARHLNNLIKRQREREIRPTSQTFAFPSVVFLQMTLAPTRKISSPPLSASPSRDLRVGILSGFLHPSQSSLTLGLVHFNTAQSPLQPEKRRGETTLGTAVNHGPTAAQIRTAFSSDRLTSSKSIDRSPKTRGSNPQMQRCSRQLHTIVARLPLDSARYLARSVECRYFKLFSLL